MMLENYSSHRESRAINWKGPGWLASEQTLRAETQRGAGIPKRKVLVPKDEGRDLAMCDEGTPCTGTLKRKN